MLIVEQDTKNELETFIIGSIAMNGNGSYNHTYLRYKLHSVYLFCAEDEAGMRREGSSRAYFPSLTLWCGDGKDRSVEGSTMCNVHC